MTSDQDIMARVTSCPECGGRPTMGPSCNITCPECYDGAPDAGRQLIGEGYYGPEHAIESWERSVVEWFDDGMPRPATAEQLLEAVQDLVPADARVAINHERWLRSGYLTGDPEDAWSVIVREANWREIVDTEIHETCLAAYIEVREQLGYPVPEVSE